MAGNKVRFATQRRSFQNGHIGNWPEEIFVIATRMPTVPVTYKLKDLVGDDIKGTFCSDELQMISKPEDALFNIERIVKREREPTRSSILAWISGKVQLAGRTLDETMNSRGFHVTLPSSSTMDCYPTNTVAQFTTKRHHQIALEGDWEVALTEISVPITLNNVTKDTCFVEHSKWPSGTWMYTEVSGYYDSVVELMNFLSEVLADRGVTFTLWVDKAKMTNDGDYEVRFSPSLSKKL